MGGIVMWVAIILLIILMIASVVCLWSKLGEDRSVRISCGIGLIFSSMFWGMTIALATTPTIGDYVNGRVETEITTTVKDGEIIKCDTLYYKKIVMWIARDFDNSLWLFTDKPYKDDVRWRLPIGDGRCQPLLEYLFPEVKWEDEEPRELILK